MNCKNCEELKIDLKNERKRLADCCMIIAKCYEGLPIDKAEEFVNNLKNKKHE